MMLANVVRQTAGRPADHGNRVRSNRIFQNPWLFGGSFLICAHDALRIGRVVIGYDHVLLGFSCADWHLLFFRYGCLRGYIFCTWRFSPSKSDSISGPRTISFGSTTTVVACFARFQRSLASFTFSLATAMPALSEAGLSAASLVASAVFSCDSLRRVCRLPCQFFDFEPVATAALGGSAGFFSEGRGFG